MPRAEKAHKLGLSGDTVFAEESILNARLLSNRKSNARKSEFRAIDYRRNWAGFRAFVYAYYHVSSDAEFLLWRLTISSCRGSGSSLFFKNNSSNIL